MEDYFEGALTRIDSVLGQALELRREMALQLRALRMATDHRVDEALALHSSLTTGTGWPEAEDVTDLVRAAREQHSS